MPWPQMKTKVLERVSPGGGFVTYGVLAAGLPLMKQVSAFATMIAERL